MPQVTSGHARGTATITIDRLAARNAISLSVMDDLRLVLTELRANDAHVVIFRGAGNRPFVAGGDLKELASIRTVGGAAGMARKMWSLLDMIASLPMPTVAALNGHALGGRGIRPSVRFAFGR